MTDSERDSELAYLRDAVAQLEWTFAKTMAHIPHSYIVRGKTAPDEVYERLFEAILRYGQNMKFGPYRNRYLFLDDGHKYWAMTRNNWESRIINRDDVLDPAGWAPGEPEVKS